MKRILFALLVFPIIASANIYEVDINKITQDKNLQADLIYLKDNKSYYNHWEREWKHEISKKEVTNKLKGIYKRFASLPVNNTEKLLLLGDISHFLYNLEQEKYHEIAVTHFEAAIKQSPNDYRGYWFLGNHYSMSAKPLESAEQYFKAESMLPATSSEYFWEEYAYALYLAQMPAHALYAMDKQQKLTGMPGDFEKKMGFAIQKGFVDADLNHEYDVKETWDVAKGKKITFTSYALGMSIAMNEEWGVEPMGLQKGQGVFIINPPKLKNQNAKEIGYTMMVLGRAAGKDDKLEDFLNVFIKKRNNKKKLTFSEKYPGMIAYQIIDNSIYKDVGGGHMIIMAIERNVPDFPGFTLETPLNVFKETGVTFFRADKRITRVSDRMFYLFLVDTCNDIYPQCFNIAKEVFEKDLVIE